MPTISLIVNVKPDDEKAFILAFAKAASQLLGVRESATSIDFTYNPTLSFGGSFDPAFSLRIVRDWSIN
jgi:phenylpyruvate tautomerase